MLESRHLYFCHGSTTAASYFVGTISSLYISKAFKNRIGSGTTHVVGKWIEVIAVGESCFVGRHCCYVDSDAGEASQQRALLLLKLPLKKKKYREKRYYETAKSRLARRGSTRYLCTWAPSLPDRPDISLTLFPWIWLDT